MNGCMLCPRKCGADRTSGAYGACGVGKDIFVARAAPHHFEEPPISGKSGSGAVFFAGCSLGCIFCQNKEISRGEYGNRYDEPRLAELFLSLAADGVHNLNLVTGTHYTDRIARVLAKIKPQLKIPVIWNSSAYETPETLRLLEGLVDIYLPDFKYFSPDLARTCSGAADYAVIATRALAEMHRQVGAVRLDDTGMMCGGLLVRHLLLPGCRHDSEAVLRHLSTILPVNEIYLSLMRQYTPDFAPKTAPRHLRRRVTSFEYNTVAALAESLGFEGFLQGAAAASAAYTPDFSEK